MKKENPPTQQQAAPRATQFIRNEHKRIRGLFTQFEAVDLRALSMQTGVARELFMELEVHAQLEEEYFYPEFKALAAVGDQGLIERGYQAHNEILESIGALRVIGPEGSEFDDRFRDLKDTVEGHFEEEEQSLLPVAERLLGPRLQDMGAQMQFRREELIQAPQYQGARPEEVQNPSGGEQMRKQKLAS